jgi:D-alanine-D-alanine ligase
VGGIAPAKLPPPVCRDLRILFIAKHAHWDGGLHSADGNHAVYHREMRAALEAMELDLVIADDHGALFERPAVDFVFPLLNRAGFLNSEMLAPLLCERMGLPYLGASPILRGLSDDKHLAKTAAMARGAPTTPWAIYRRGAPLDPRACPAAERFVVKPNASSASWGVSEAAGWDEVRSAALALHAQGHDAIVEPFLVGHDIEVPVITVGGEPFLLPVQIVEQADPSGLRTYAEKRSLGLEPAYAIRPLEDARLQRLVENRARAVLKDYWPLDYGRVEFRLDMTTGEAQFLEINLNCNLWSRKTIALAAAQIGWSHRELVETILAESLMRQKLLGEPLDAAA